MNDRFSELPHEERFQARVDAEQKIEPKDWMPDKYRQNLIRRFRSMLTSHGSSPRVSGLREPLSGAQGNSHRKGSG